MWLMHPVDGRSERAGSGALLKKQASIHVRSLGCVFPGALDAIQYGIDATLLATMPLFSSQLLKASIEGSWSLFLAPIFGEAPILKWIQVFRAHLAIALLHLEMRESGTRAVSGHASGWRSRK